MKLLTPRKEKTFKIRMICPLRITIHKKSYFFRPADSSYIQILRILDLDQLSEKFFVPKSGLVFSNLRF